MPDGKRKRRFSPIGAKRQWYAAFRDKRFAARQWGDPRDALLSELATMFGGGTVDEEIDAALEVLARYLPTV